MVVKQIEENNFTKEDLEENTKLNSTLEEFISNHKAK